MGGKDLATLYGAGSQTQWQQGSDFIRFIEQGLTREARGFQSVETYIAGQAHALAPAATYFETIPPQDQFTQSPEANLQLEHFHSPLARHTLPEMQVIRQTRELSDWLTERMQLPDEALLVDPEQEFALLDEIFSASSVGS